MLERLVAHVELLGYLVLGYVTVAATLPLAALAVGEEDPRVRAPPVGPAPAIVFATVATFVSFPLGVVLAAPAEYLAIERVFDLEDRPAAQLTVVHVGTVGLLLAGVRWFSPRL